MVDLILIRHLESVWNSKGLEQGQMDTPLSDVGRRQCARLEQLAITFPEVNVVYTSDLARVAEAARAMAIARGWKVIARADLREQDVGEWEGQQRAGILRRWPAYDDPTSEDSVTMPPPGGESRLMLRSRIQRTLEQICTEVETGTAFVVSHGEAIRAALAALSCSSRWVSSTWAIGNAHFTGLRKHPDGAWSIRYVNREPPIQRARFTNPLT